MLYVDTTLVNRTQNIQFYCSEEPEETGHTQCGSLFREMQREYGRCSGAMYRDRPDGSSEQIGWVFEKRMLYEDAFRRRDNYDSTTAFKEGESYIREAWVRVLDLVEPARPAAWRNALEVA